MTSGGAALAARMKKQAGKPYDRKV
ncbi:protein of unknown function [Burkholderia multivorans]